MAQYDNTNSGMIARNENRKTDKHPEYTGSLNVDGVDYWVSAWVNEGKMGGKMGGKKYFSIKVNRKEQDSRGGFAAPAGRPAADGFIDDDLPF